MMINMEKNLIFISDQKYIDAVLTLTRELRERSNNKNDVDIVINKLLNIKELCQKKTKS